MNEKEYKLKVEILVHSPSYAELEKGQICRANDNGTHFDVEDASGNPSSNADWGVEYEDAKIVSEGTS